MAQEPQQRQQPGSGQSQRPDGQQPRPTNPLRNWRFWATLVVLLVINFALANLVMQQQQPKQVTISYNAFVQQVNNNNVSQITSTGDSIQGQTKQAVADASDSSQK